MAIIQRFDFSSATGLTKYESGGGSVTVNQTQASKTPCVKVLGVGSWHTNGFKVDTGRVAAAGDMFYVSCYNNVGSNARNWVFGAGPYTDISAFHSPQWYCSDGAQVTAQDNGDLANGQWFGVTGVWAIARVTINASGFAVYATATDNDYAGTFTTRATGSTDYRGQTFRFTADCNNANTPTNDFYFAQYYVTDGTFTPPTPTAGSAAAAGQTSIDIDWTDVATATNADGISIERSLSSGSGFAEIDTESLGVEAYSDSGLDAGTAYYYKVRAFVVVGGTTFYGSYSSEMTATTDASPSNPGAEMLVLGDLE